MRSRGIQGVRRSVLTPLLPLLTSLASTASSDPAVVFAAECLFNGPDWVESEDHASSPSEHDDAAYEPIDSPSQAADAAFLGVLSAVQQQQQRNASSSSSSTFTTSIPLSLSDLTALSSALPLSSSSSQPAQSLSPSQIPADGILSDSALSPASLPSLMSAIAELEQCVARLSLEASEARRLQRRMRGAVGAASAAGVGAGAAGEGEAEAGKKKGKNRKKKKKVPAASAVAPPPPAVAPPPAPKQREAGAGADDSDLLNALHSVSMLDRRADEYRERLRVLKVRRALSHSASPPITRQSADSCLRSCRTGTNPPPRSNRRPPRFLRRRLRTDFVWRTGGEWACACG